MQKNTAVNRLKKVCILRLQVKQKNFYSNEDIYNASISMYDSEALALYNQYLEQAPASISEGEDFAVAALEGFTQYAVEEGIIEDTVEQRAAITKAVVRAEFRRSFIPGEHTRGVRDRNARAGYRFRAVGCRTVGWKLRPPCHGFAASPAAGAGAGFSAVGRAAGGSGL